MSSAPILPLESLSVAVVCDPAPFIAGARRIEATLNHLAEMLGSFVMTVDAVMLDVADAFAALPAAIAAQTEAISLALAGISSEFLGWGALIESVWAESMAGLVAIPAAITATVPQIGIALTGIVTETRNAVVMIQDMAVSLSWLMTALERFTSSLASVHLFFVNFVQNLGPVIPMLGRLRAYITALGGVGASLTPLTTALGQLATAITSLTTLNISALELALTLLSGSIQVLVLAAAGLPVVVSELAALAVALGKLSTISVASPARLLAALASLAGHTPARLVAVFSEIAAGLDLLQSRFVNIANLSGVAANALGRLLGTLVRLAGIASGTLPALAAEIDILTTSLAALGAVPVEAKLIRLVNALTRVGAVSPAVMTSLAGLTTAVNTLAASLAKLPLVPPVIPTAAPVAATAVAVGSVGTAAKAAVLPTMSFNKSLVEMNSAARVAGAGLGFLKMSVGFFSAYGVFAAAKLDDTITKILARQGEPVRGPLRAPLEAALKELAGRSLSKLNDLGDALSIIMRTGQSAGMAMKSLADAENLATVSGENVSKSAEHLTYILRALGKEGDTPAKQLAAQQHLADILVGVSLKTGSSVGQLAEALDKRLTSSMRLLNLSLEDAIPLLGVYSERLAKGASGGDLLARALNLVADRAIKGINMKIGLIDPFDEKGQFKLLDWLTKLDTYLTHKVGSTPKSRMAELIGLGFEKRAIPSLLPLLGAAPEMKALQSQLGGMEGLNQKIADSIRGSFLSQLKILWHQIGLTAIAIGDTLAPAIKLLISGIESLTGWFMRLNPAFRNLIVWATAAYFALLPLARLTFHLVAGSLMTLLAPIRMVISLVETGLAAILQIPLMIWSAVTKVVAGFGYLLGIIGQVASAAWYVFTLPVKLAYQVADGLYVIGKSVANFFVNLTANLATGLVSILTGLLALIINIIGSMFLLSAAAAVVVTVGLGLGSVFAALGAGIMAAWNGIKSAVSSSADWLKNKVEEVKPAIGRMWEGTKVAAADFFVYAGNGITWLAGFFWHLGDNAVVVFHWIGRNWAELVQDMGSVTVHFVENMVENLGVLGRAIVNAAGAVWGRFWEAATAYGKFAFNWFKSNWPDVLDAMWTTFKTFMGNLLQNFMASFQAIGRMLKESILSAFRETKAETTIVDEIGRLKKMRDYPALRRGTSFAKQSTEDIQDSIDNLEAELEKVQNRKYTSIIGKALEQFNEPLKGLPPLKLFQPPVQTEQEKVLNVPPVSVRRWTKAHSDAVGAVTAIASDLASVFILARDKLKGPLEGFVSIIQPYTIPTPQAVKQITGAGVALGPLAAASVDQSLTNNLGRLINAQLPSDALDKMLQGLKKFMGGITGAEAPDLIGKESAGFQFKQISLSRYMLGGTFAASLDAQQLNQLHALNEKTRALLEANKKIEENTRPRNKAVNAAVNAVVGNPMILW